MLQYLPVSVAPFAGVKSAPFRFVSQSKEFIDTILESTLFPIPFTAIILNL